MPVFPPRLGELRNFFPDQESVDNDQPLTGVIIALHAGDTQATIRTIDPDADYDTVYGPPDGTYITADATPVPLVEDPLGVSAYSATLDPGGLAQWLNLRSDIIFPLTGFISSAWSPDPATPVAEGGSLRTNIPNRPVTLGQVQTSNRQIRNQASFDVQDQAGSPMTLEIWNSTSGLMVAQQVTDGSGVRKDYTFAFSSPQTGEYVYSAVAISGSATPGFCRVFEARIQEA